jgi:hypothetical protein
LPNRLDPAVVLQMQPLQDRCQVGRNRPSTRRANLTSRPVHQRNIGVASELKSNAKIDASCSSRSRIQSLRCS